MPYAEWLPRNAPTYLQDKFGLAWMAGIGAAFDDYVQEYIAGILASFPDYAPSDALAVIGGEFGLDRGPLETDGSYAARLRAAWIYWALAGTPCGLLVALHFAGFPSAVLAQQNGLAYNLSAAPVPGVDPKPLLVVTPTAALAVDLASNILPPTIAQVGRSIPAGNQWWSIDSDTDFCSRFDVLFPGPLPSPFVTWGRATFTGVEDGGGVPWPLAIWNNPFSDLTYKMKPSAATVTDGGGGVITWVDATTQSLTGVRVAASASFSGFVDVLAYQAGATNPFADIHPNDLARLQRTIVKWRPGKATCRGVFVNTQGKFSAWPVGTMAQMLGVKSTIVQIAGSL